ncbi:MAG: sulfatase-like hydrolase/transferase [Treponema sp.]|nr:sulfatase-like hydrolase/transferase [Treponema sp.]
MDKLPNILFIMADQHRFDCTGYSNSNLARTPCLDRLASDGMGFTNAYTPIPICCPARQALLNGRRPEAFGALWNYDNGLKTGALEPSEYSWPSDLKQLGYRTGHTGKWHVNPVHDPTAYGYDDYIDGEYWTFRKEKYPGAKAGGTWFGGIDPVPLEDSHTHWLARRTSALMEKYTAEGKPWLIRMDFTEPHPPYRPAMPFAEMYRSADIPKWPGFDDDFKNKPYIQKQQLLSWGIENLGWDDWAPIIAKYFGMVSQMDSAIGRVLDKLDSLGIADNTIVIYSTDHGDMCGSHRMMDKHYVMYDDVIKVPFIMRWPGVITPGSVCRDFVYSILDLPPSILEITGLQPKEFFHGRSLLPLLKGQTPNDWRSEVISTYNGQQFGLYTQRMIRGSRWKYVWNHTDTDELYDMENDPGELVNLIHEQSRKTIISEYRKKLYDELVRCGDSIVDSRWMKSQLLENKKI